jgi:hypothetical protein
MAARGPELYFYLRFFFAKLEAKGEGPCHRAYVIALVMVLVLGLPVGVGLGWRVATGDFSIIPTALGKGVSYISSGDDKRTEPIRQVIGSSRSLCKE